MIAQPLLKSIMAAVFGGLGAALLVLAFRRVPASLLEAVLEPRAGAVHRDVRQDALLDTGLRYLLILTMSTAMGCR